MENRFNELSEFEQQRVSQLINALAANGHVRMVTRDLIIYDAINKIHDAGRIATALEDLENAR